VEAGESLPEHVQKQVEMLTNDATLVQTAGTIVNSLDEDGYLQTPLEDIAEMTGEPLERVEQALKLVQQCDPYGVGARNLSECLELQYHAWEMGDPPLLEIIRHHLDDLLRHRWDRIARALQMTEAEVQEIADDIAMMEPRPGRQYGSYDNEYVTPDVFIEKEGSEYLVRVNDSWIPSLRLNRQYRNMLARRDELNPEERRYLKSKLHAAVDLINNIEQRKQTLYRVTKEIVRQQRDFLDNGVEHLRPMRLRDVADIVGVHETTVCRVVNGKYAQTPQGLLELKYFFSTGLRSTDGGEDASAKAVKARIQQLVDEEPPAKPLSDSKISAILEKAGIQVARRTVAKYRDQLGILPTSQRRRGRN
jgi:RNA polymerase sigma-54 factor